MIQAAADSTSNVWSASMPVSSRRCLECLAIDLTRPKFLVFQEANFCYRRQEFNQVCLSHHQETSTQCEPTKPQYQLNQWWRCAPNHHHMRLIQAGHHPCYPLRPDCPRAFVPLSKYSCQVASIWDYCCWCCYDTEIPTVHYYYSRF